MMQSSEPSGPSELFLALALRAGGIGIWRWDLKTNAFHYSGRAREIFGFPPDIPITYEMAVAVTHPEDFPFTSAQARRALDPDIRQNRPFEYRVIRADTGEVRWVEADGEAVFETVDGRTVATSYVGTIKDITEGRLQRLALEDSERSLRLALAAAGMAVWDYDVASGKLISSAQLKRIFGYPPEADPSVEEYRQHYQPGEYEKLTAAGQSAMASGLAHFEVEFQIERVDGVSRWLLLRAEILSNAAGQPERAVGVVLDIDAQKRGAERQQVLVHELNHRLKNSMAVVSAVAKQTFKGEFGEAAHAAFSARLKALVAANDAVVDGGWDGFSLFRLIRTVTAPFVQEGYNRLDLVGSDAVLPRRYNELLALAFHELATNASKYGSLSAEGGRVSITCVRQEDHVQLRWQESGGPEVAEPQRQGFGAKLLSGILARSFRSFRYEFEPTGVRCEIEIGLSPLR